MKIFIGLQDLPCRTTGPDHAGFFRFSYLDDKVWNIPRYANTRIQTYYKVYNDPKCFLSHEGQMQKMWYICQWALF